MTTRQIDTRPLDRPLSDVDEIAERIHASTAGQGDRPVRASWEPRDAIERLSRDPRIIMGVLVATVTLIVLAVAFGRRPPPRTAQDALLEGTEAAFQRARESLDAIAARLASRDQ